MKEIGGEAGWKDTMRMLPGQVSRSLFAVTSRHSRSRLSPRSALLSLRANCWPRLCVALPHSRSRGQRDDASLCGADVAEIIVVPTLVGRELGVAPGRLHFVSGRAHRNGSGWARGGALSFGAITARKRQFHSNWPKGGRGTHLIFASSESMNLQF